MTLESWGASGVLEGAGELVRSRSENDGVGVGDLLAVKAN